MSEDKADMPSQGIKRAQESLDGPLTKRAHVDGDESEGHANDQLSVKILIPSSAVGAIIGKGGEAMRLLKTDHQCRVQMSKNNDTYPGTSERICLVKGRAGNVLAVIEAISEKIREKCEGVVGSDAFDHKGAARGNEVKIVMPNTSAGMVIGKAGANIKDIRESFGVLIQVFPKAGTPEAKNSLERVVTVAQDDIPALMGAVSRVIEKVAADPHHTSEIMKEDFGKSSGGGNQSFNSGTGGNYGMQNGAQPNYGQAPNQYSAQPQVNAPYNYGSNQGLPTIPPNFKLNPMSGIGNNEVLTFLDTLQNCLRTSGFAESSVTEVMNAMQVLAKYNIMGLGLGLGVAAMAHMRQGDQQPMQQAGQGGMVNHGSAGFGEPAGYQPQQQQEQNSVYDLLTDVLHRRSGTAAGSTENFASGVIVTKCYDEESMELEVPDTIIGAVLGPKAKTLVDIQNLSGCKMQVFKREAKPNLPLGTRMISLTGTQECMQMCLLMIERVINDAQERRVRNSGASNAPVSLTEALGV